MEYSEIFKQISKEQNLPIEVVEEVYKSFYKFIRSKIIELPLKDELYKAFMKKLSDSESDKKSREDNIRLRKQIKVLKQIIKEGKDA